MVRFLAFSLFVTSFITDAKTAPDLEVLQRNSDVNQLKILDNRFRIDHRIDEITLVFFRKRGAPSVILVQPDGSKLYSSSAMRNASLEWIDEVSYDVIRIKQPMPGPWQAIGQILPESKIMILSDIELAVDPLPPLMFKGETIKVTGRLTNGGKPVEDGLFGDLVNLDVNFVSTNNKDFNNFGASTEQVATFKDDGLGFDEKPRDAVFTGEFTLNFPAGEWRPEYQIDTPLIKRSLEQAPVVVDPIPFNFEFVESTDLNEPHKVNIVIDDSKVDPNTVVFQGKIFYPNHEQQEFTIDATNTSQRELAVNNYEWGVYTVEFSVFGTNSNGREFMAKLDNKEFEIEKPIEVVPEIAPETMPELFVEPEPEPQDNTMVIVAALLGNLFILLAGYLVIRKFVQHKPLLPNISFGFLKRNKNKVEEKNSAVEQKSNTSDEILNLSMPKD